MAGHTEKSDIWSVGCLTVELLTGHPPYWELEQMRAIFCVVQDESPPIPSGISSECKDFLMCCFVKNLEERASASELLNHPWIVKAKQKKSSFKKLTKSLKLSKKKKSGKKKIKVSPPKKSVHFEGDIVDDLICEDEREKLLKSPQESDSKPLIKKKKPKKQASGCFCCV